MRAKKYKCVECGVVIPADRAERALSRGVEPRYCSAKCRNRFSTRAYIKRKKDAE